ncbi:hypothetical protein GCM10023238_28650 [Streptomyces heliomycini]
MAVERDGRKDHQHLPEPRQSLAERHEDIPPQPHERPHEHRPPRPPQRPPQRPQQRVVQEPPGHGQRVPHQPHRHDQHQHHDPHGEADRHDETPLARGRGGGRTGRLLEIHAYGDAGAARPDPTCETLLISYTERR